MPAHASLKRIYRLVWSALHQTWVVASELARGRGKSNATSLISAALLVSLAGLSGGLWAAPQGGQVVSGSGSISASGNAGQSTTTITQASDKLSINWQSFNVGTSETVNFVQPSASALAVNRILDTQGSQILGKINANGQVWLINPNGVLFGRDAQINVGGLLASTLNPDDASIGSARSNFSGNSTAGVVNLGSINAAQGGYVALLGHSVSNQGSISAPGGTVALGAGSAIRLNFAGSKLLGLEVTSNQVNALAENGGLIQSDGGQVLLSAGARESLLASVVNNTGVIQARTVQEQDGKIILLGGMAAGATNVKGTLDASAPNGGNGGFIETSAYTVNVDDSASITTASAQGTQGQWLIDPFDFYIASSGGNITGDALGRALDSNDVTIQTTNSGTTATGAAATDGNSGNGDIYLNDAVTWTGSKTLTLSAYRNININSAITGTTGGLTLTAGRNNNNPGAISVPSAVSVGNFNLTRGTWKQVAEQLPGFSATSFQLTLNHSTFIRALGGDGSSSSPYRIADIYGLQGIGNSRTTRANHYALANDIDASGTWRWNQNSGFSPITAFTSTFDGQGHTITGLTINRSSSGNVGLFSHLITGGVVQNVGLVNASVSGAFDVGILAGLNEGSISNSYATGRVSGLDMVGGLVGGNSGEISNSYATASVSSLDAAGGLVGINSSGRISNSYATGLVSALVGAPGDAWFGGLVGINEHENSGTVSNSFWNTTTSGQAYSDGGSQGLSTADMLRLANYTTANGNPNWDFDNTWYMVDGFTRPFLLTFLTPLTVTYTISGNKTYDGTTTCGNITCSYTTSTLNSGKNLLGTAAFVLSSQNAGTVTGGGSGLYSDQQGYLITASNSGTATIAKKALTVTDTTAADKTYDGNTTATITLGTISGFVDSEMLSVTTSGTFYSKNAGSRTATAIYTLASDTGSSGGLADNYSLADTTHSATIAKAALTYTANNASRNTGETPTGFSGTVSGFVNNETQSTATTGTLAWIAEASSKSSAGRYAINGSGLLADNYSFGQAEANARALTLIESARLIPPPITVQSSGLRSTNKPVTGTTPLSIPVDINTFAATAAGTGSPVTSLGGTGFVYVAAQGVLMGTGTIDGP